MYLLLAIVFSIFEAACCFNQNCPVSSGYDSSQVFHGYPIDLFFSSVSLDRGTAFNCSLSHGPEVILCNRDTLLCPITDGNIKSAMSVPSWPQYIDAVKKLGRKERMNVFYLGGSMTRGGETVHRCYCKKSADARCPPLPARVTSESYCSWTTHMTNWLARTYSNTQFEFYDYSAGGRSSRSADYFIDRVYQTNANMSHSSLFFLDYSVNDAHKHSGISLESLIRTIYANFGTHYNTKPTIVVIEQYAHALAFSTNQDKMLKVMNTSRDYAVGYRRVAKHYNAILISLREVYWTYFGDVEERNISDPNVSHRYPFSPFEQNVHITPHPPSFLHLYVADVLASSLIALLKRKDSTSTVHDLPFSTTRTVTRMPNNTAAITTTTVSLPTPLYDQELDMPYVCDLSRPFPIQAVAQAQTVNFVADHTLGWVEYLDTHDPGWIINNQSDPTMRALSFPLRGTANLTGHMLHLSYLVSYEGRGTATVHICGKPLSAESYIDSLWNHKVSIPNIFVALISADEASRCLTVPVEQRAVNVVYSPGEDKLELRSVRNSQFKLLTMQVCSVFPM